MSTIRKFECKRSANNFCYACGLFIFRNKLNPISEVVKTAYHEYFGFPVKKKKQDKNCVPHVMCINCKSILLVWSTGGNRSFPFGEPIVITKIKYMFLF